MDNTGGQTFTLDKWPSGDININSLPSDADNLKKWLKCHLFVNQKFDDINYVDTNGNIIIKKSRIEAAEEFINAIDKLVTDFMKTL